MSGPTPIRAVTFDFWNTLYADEKGVSEERTLRRSAAIATAVVAAAQGYHPSAEFQERIARLLHQATRLRDEASRGFAPGERIVWLLVMWKALNYQAYRLPFIGDIARSQVEPRTRPS